MKKETIVGAVCALLILLFVYAGASKLINLPEFSRDMHNQPFPFWVSTLLIWTIPILEIIISIALLFDNTRLLGLWSSLILMGLFTIYAISILLHFFRYVPCGCGGIIRSLNWKQHLLLNIFFTGVAVIGILSIEKRSKKDQSSQMIYT